MNATDLTHRLPGSHTSDELADLAQAFNGLLDRLAEAFDCERRFAGEASHQLRTPLTALIDKRKSRCGVTANRTSTAR